MLCRDFSLADAFRNKYPNKREYTWCNPSKTIVIRLDRFYVSKNLLKDLLSVTHCPIVETISDHGIIQLICVNTHMPVFFR